MKSVLFLPRFLVHECYLGAGVPTGYTLYMQNSDQKSASMSVHEWSEEVDGDIGT